MCLCYRMKKKLPEEVEGMRWQLWASRDDSQRSLPELEFLEKPGIFELDDLLRSAAHPIGRGSLGITYKAMLECGSVVAVKRLEQVKPSSKKEFAQQMQLIGNMKHPNLAEMISFYHSQEEKLIVYEYIPDSSLFSLLHENRGTGRVVLDWNTRLVMMREIAKGLEHIHERGTTHGNLKSSNVLIQRDDAGTIRVKLTDYGFIGVVETAKLAIGRSPEYLEGKKVKKAADMYCLGILILEIVTGRVPTRDLSEWVREAASIDWSMDIVDVEIVGEKEGYNDMLRVTEIALECSDELPERRPTITQVLTRLMHPIIPPQAQPPS